MADKRPNRDAGMTSDTKRESIRSSNDRDQEMEREGIESDRNRGYDEAVTGQSETGDEESEDVDPDSAEANVDRDDTIDEI